MLVFYSPYAGVQTTSTVQRLQSASAILPRPKQKSRNNLSKLCLKKKTRLEIATNRVAKATNFCD